MDVDQAAPEETQFVTPADAARRASVPARTIYRWVTSKKVRSRRQDNAVVVSLTDVVALATARGATSVTSGSLPGIAGTGAIIAATGSVTLSKADVAARLFDLFEGGMRPVEAVRSERLDPMIVAEVHRAWRGLRDLSPAGAVTADKLAEELSVLRVKLTNLQDAFRTFVEQQADKPVVEMLGEIDLRISWLEERLNTHRPGP